MHDSDAPLLEAWKRFVDSDVAPFTVPGHKRRAGAIWPSLGELLHGDVPLFGGIDTIKRGAAALAGAERLGAELWDADWCRYSTGGSTQANQVMALAVGRPGAKVLVSRSAHRSTLSGLILAGLEPVWLPTEIDPLLGLPTGLSLPSFEAAFAGHPDAVAVFCVEPSFVGSLSDLPAIIALAHAHDVPVIVDQAWGAHFGFHPAYPPHALQLGADAMITSAHKALPAYSQGSILVTRGDRLDTGRLDRALDALASTSPSGAILASIDASRALLADPLGRELLQRQVEVVAAARSRLRAAGFTSPGPDDFAPDRFDPAKLVVQLTETDGNAIEQALVEAGLPVELADRDTIIAMVTLLDDADTLDRFCDAILAAPLERVPRHRAISSAWTTIVPPVAMSPRDAFFAEHEVVAAEHAVGRVSSELIAPYPPGIPVLAPGEVITRATIEALDSAARSGVRIAYAQDPSLRSYEVVIE
jgi:arginine decarboxylase